MNVDWLFFSFLFWDLQPPQHATSFVHAYVHLFQEIRLLRTMRSVFCIEPIVLPRSRTGMDETPESQVASTNRLDGVIRMLKLKSTNTVVG